MDNSLKETIRSALFLRDTFDNYYNRIKNLVEWCDSTPQSVIDDGLDLKAAEGLEKEKIENEFFNELIDNIDIILLGNS